MSLLDRCARVDQLRHFVMGTLGFRDAVVVKVHALNCTSCMDSILDLYLALEDPGLREADEQLPHPTKDQILAYVKGEVVEEDQDWIAEHCLECEACDQLCQEAARIYWN